MKGDGRRGCAEPSPMIIVLDIDNIICYITILNNGEWHNEKNNPRHQESLGATKRRVA